MSKDVTSTLDKKPQSERVHVYCRIKPHFSSVGPEEDTPRSTTTTTESTFVTTSNAISGLDDQCLAISPDDAEHTVTFHDEKHYSYDSILPPSISQSDVYQKSAFKIVSDVMEGYNGTIFAYGQTGSGKTHSMLGPENDPLGPERGIIPRALQDIFSRVDVLNGSSNTKVEVKVSYVQIYCERIFDLLNPESASMSIREDSDTGVYVQGATVTSVSTVQACLDVIAIGTANRNTASTSMNASSSRSHAIFIVQVERTESTGSSSQVKRSQLYLVDLAGSERVSKSLKSHTTYGTRFNELKSINLSLSALGNCVSALSNKSASKQHVPYRDSKLTRLLQSSLGGNSKTSLIITVSADDAEASETNSTLQFGSRCMKVTVNAHLNIRPDYKALYESVQAQIDSRDDRINDLEMKLQASCDREAALSEDVKSLEAVRDDLTLQLKVAVVRATEVSTTSNGDDGDGSSGIAELRKKFNDEVVSLREEHLSAIDALKKQYDTEVLTYKKSASSANQEWNDTQYQLSSEKTTHLETLADYRECRAALTKLEKESSDRIAELLTLLEEAKSNSRKQDTHGHEVNSSLLTLEGELRDTKVLLSEAEAKYLKLHTRMKEDYVAREQIDQMEKLYSDAITRLQGRVDSIEKSNNNNSNNNASDRNNDRLQASNASLKKAVPRVGRVQPPGKKSTSKSRFK